MVIGVALRTIVVPACFIETGRRPPSWPWLPRPAPPIRKSTDQRGFMAASDHDLEKELTKVARYRMREQLKPARPASSGRHLGAVVAGNCA